jgi:hypothetical protein
MPNLEDAIDFWESLGGATWHYDQMAALKKDSSVTTTINGVDKTSGVKWSKTITRSAPGGICLSLAIRVVEARMMGYTEEDLVIHIKASFQLAKLQQALTREEKEWYTAGGVEGIR